MFFSSKLYFKYKNVNSQNNFKASKEFVMRKVALPICNNQLSPGFNQSSEFVIFTIENNRNIKKDLLYTHLQPGLFPFWLAKKGVTDVIAMGIDINTVSKFNKFKINVFAGVESCEPELLVEEFLKGTLETSGLLVDN